MEVFAEQTLINENIDKYSKRTKLIGSLRYVFVVLIAVLFFLFWLADVNTDEPLTSIIFNLLFFLSASIPFVAGIVFITRWMRRANVEYDYLLAGDIFRIVKVLNRAKRKLMLEISVSSIESIGKIESETYERYSMDSRTKNLFAIFKDSPEKDILYIFYKENGVNNLLHILPDEQMMLAFRRSVSRITVIDKSLKSGAIV